MVLLFQCFGVQDQGSCPSSQKRVYQRCFFFNVEQSTRFLKSPFLPGTLFASCKPKYSYSSYSSWSLDFIQSALSAAIQKKDLAWSHLCSSWMFHRRLLFLFFRQGLVPPGAFPRKSGWRPMPLSLHALEGFCWPLEQRPTTSLASVLRGRLPTFWNRVARAVQAFSGTATEQLLVSNLPDLYQNLSTHMRQDWCKDTDLLKRCHVNFPF